MAFLNQEKKAKIVVELKKVIPADWKYSLSVHHSSITLRIMAAPIDLFAAHSGHSSWSNGYIQLNEFCLEGQFSGDLLEIFKKIRDAMNTGNWDKSDIMSDYFNVGHYAYIHIGRWDKPFQVISEKKMSYEELRAKVAALESKIQSKSAAASL